MKRWKLVGTAALAAVLAFGCATKESAAADKGAQVGGDCCADLDERVAELEASVARKGNQKVRLVISGQVNQALIWHNRDEIDRNKIVDNDIGESRINLRGSAEINAQWSAGFAIVMGLGDAINEGANVDVRENYVWLKIKNFGTIKFGKHSMATDGIQEISLSSGASNASVLGSLSPFDDFIRLQTGFGLTNPLDGGRKDGVSFSSSSLAGFSVSASWGDDESWEAALRYAGEFGDIRVAGGIGYRDEEETAFPRTYWGGSASIQHLPSGIFVDGFYGKSEGVQTATFDLVPDIRFTFALGDTTVTAYGGRAGIDIRGSEVGKTTIFGEYQILEIDGAGDNPMLYGVGINQAIDAAAMDIYLSYRHIDLNGAFGIDETADVVTAGAKIRF